MYIQGMAKKFYNIQLSLRRKDCEVIGARLRQARLNAGRTQEYMAGKLGCKQGNYSRWEDGRFYSIDRLEKCARILGIPVSDILGSEGKKIAGRLTNGK